MTTIMSLRYNNTLEIVAIFYCICYIICNNVRCTCWQCLKIVTVSLLLGIKIVLQKKLSWNMSIYCLYILKYFLSAYTLFMIIENMYLNIQFVSLSVLPIVCIIGRRNRISIICWGAARNIWFSSTRTLGANIRILR